VIRLELVINFEPFLLTKKALVGGVKITMRIKFIVRKDAFCGATEWAFHA